jgi:hypothetical protein
VNLRTQHVLASASSDIYDLPCVRMYTESILQRVVIRPIHMNLYYQKAHFDENMRPRNIERSERSTVEITASPSLSIITTTTRYLNSLSTTCS